MQSEDYRWHSDNLLTIERQEMNNQNAYPMKLEEKQKNSTTLLP